MTIRSIEYFSKMPLMFSFFCTFLRCVFDLIFGSIISRGKRFRIIFSKEKKLVPVSVNYHFTRACNYKCGFCFHTSTSSFVLPTKVAKHGLSMLKDAGMVKVNFSGGEPFIHQRGRFLGELVAFCKTELNLDSVSIVSNGSLIREEWMAKYGKYLDILAISCDSFHASTNQKIGRWQNDKTDHIQQLHRIRDWCKKYGVVFKMNTVVNKCNVNEDMSAPLTQLNPSRWKVFQCLLIEGENAGPEALRDAQKFYVTEEEFQNFLQRHSNIDCLVAENNAVMKDSYLMLDERMRFLDCRNGDKRPSESILDVGVENALKFSGFDEKAFLERGGVYEWSKSNLLQNVDTSDW